MRTFAPVLLLALGLGACADETGPSSRVAPTKDEGPSIELLLVASRAARTALSGGALTVFDVSADAFSFAAPGLAGARLAQHDEGDDAFETVFGQGLGPVFDNTSCESCHVGDGRGRPPAGSEP